MLLCKSFGSLLVFDLVFFILTFLWTAGTCLDLVDESRWVSERIAALQKHAQGTENLWDEPASPPPYKAELDCWCQFRSRMDAKVKTVAWFWAHVLEFASRADYCWNSYGCNVGTGKEDYLKVIARGCQVLLGVSLFESLWYRWLRASRTMSSMYIFVVFARAFPLSCNPRKF
jgi:hypothetical protein